MNNLSASDLRLVNRLQKNFPLVEEPFAQIATELGRDKLEIIQRLQQLQQQGIISRFGGVNNHKRMGKSTLAALKVPPAEIEKTASYLNSFSQINHNYLREHEFNMWFVVTGINQNVVQAVLKEIAESTGFELLDLPMIKSFHLDLAFDL